MSFYQRYSLVLGLLVLACVVIVLLSTPRLVFSRGVRFIDTELYRSSGQETYVTTKLDLASNEQVQTFPMEIGEWTGFDYDTQGKRRVEESLGTDVMLLRAYDHPKLYQPIFFLIMQAETQSSFHPPPICYSGLGYQVGEEGKELISVSDPSWAENGASSVTRHVPVKKLVVFKESEGKVTERRVVLYYYGKGNRFTSSAVTMVRVEALAPVEGSYEGILNVEKAFMAKTIPYMFGPGEETGAQPVAARLAQWGGGGYLAIALLLSIPLAIMIYPRVGGRRGRNGEPGPGQ